MIDCRHFHFSNTELRLLTPFELPPVSFWGGGGGANFDAAFCKKYPELVTVFKKQAVLFETLKMQINLKTIGA
jgi:hypothetical protein